MSKKLGIVLSVICAVAVVLSIISLVFGINASKGKEDNQDIQYVLYLGTNDKDTNKPVFTPDEAKTKAEKILIEHFDGYTIQEASGGWVEGENTYQEYTLVIYISNTTIDKIHSAANDMIKAFNQSSVLIQANKTTTEFYSGTDNN